LKVSWLDCAEKNEFIKKEAKQERKNGKIVEGSKHE
jgi:hypothetical protein